MLIRLQPLTLPQIDARLMGTETVNGLHLTEDVVPHAVLAMASAALKRGQLPQWWQPRLFLLGYPPIAVGSATFKGEPVNGRIEIGYGVAHDYAGCGYATMGVRLMAAYAFAHPDVDEVLAETGIDNIASRRVVQKVGFTLIGERDSEDDGLLDRWLLSRDSFSG
ncbi:GNAT family N-acetyltransferase [Dyella psychrodurans]|uniref:N-acetyltransferase n=1 Tax=Dyella psychrodurans TaxID=1927960 RepID=A0A370XD18_9GAMM|nr:GNAT family N-acetyltransferase [Dyella psychrodurans]RDS86308.1 N-acetyltransferase [Dyella psychrodurans]